MTSWACRGHVMAIDSSAALAILLAETEDETFAERYGKGHHPAALNFGNCCAYALAAQTGEALLFEGGDFAGTDSEVPADMMTATCGDASWSAGPSHPACRAERAHGRPSGAGIWRSWCTRCTRGAGHLSLMDLDVGDTETYEGIYALILGRAQAGIRRFVG